MQKAYFELVIVTSEEYKEVFTVSSFVGNPVIKLGTPVIKLGNPVIKLGNPVIKLGK